MVRRWRPDPRRIPLFAALALSLLAALAGCADLSTPPQVPTETPAVATPPPTRIVRPTPPEETRRCEDGRIQLGDLLAIETGWADGVATATEQAQRWQADARLVQLKVACQPLEDGFRWQGRFYSDSAQSYYFSDTGQTEPAEADPSTIPTLPLDSLSFQQLHLTLARAGHADTDAFNPTSGITIRPNTPDEPFGPPGIPEAVVYYVAIELQGEVRDLFISEANWTIYSYRES
jgi:hypothetical protein